MERLLIEKAIFSTKSSYAPYSEFNVGAALLLANNKIIIGNNQENSSFPCGICAERVALFTASTNYPNITIEKIAITASPNNFKLSYPVAPCGLCRQVLLEYEEKQNTSIEIIIFNHQKFIKIAQAKALLPLYVQENKLKRK